MIFRADAGGGLEEFCGRYRDGSRLRGPNEIALGPDGRIYFTDPGRAWRGRPEGALSRVDESGRAELLAEGLEFTNGLDFTPDGKEICVVETTTGRVLRAALAADGTLAEPLREFVRFEGSVGPDGIRFAASGNLYVTLFGRGQVAVVNPKGREIDRLRVPGLFPTSVIFRGALPAGLRRPDRGHLEAGGGGRGGSFLFPESVGGRVTPPAQPVGTFRGEKAGR